MRFVRSTDEFVYAGRPRPGFPFLLGHDMRPMEPFHGYLRHRLLESGKLLQVLTWDNYGRYLWDYARFLDANGLVWDEPFLAVGSGPLAVYRDWQANDLKLDPETINHRVRFVQDMYEWTLSRGMIHELPFTTSNVTSYGIEHDMSDVTGRRVEVSKSDLLLDEWEEEPVFLTADQLHVARANIRATEHRILFDLMARVGLRSVEARTFPLRFVFDPKAQSGLKPGTLIEVKLDPRFMRTKFGKPRIVHVPYGLMEEMYAYSQFERKRRLDPERISKTLLLTIYGNGFSKGSTHKVMSDLGLTVGFAIRPLMLRHSYAIHTLLVLRANPEIKLEPLIYVRDRLGHKSVQTTMTYLSQIERLLGAEALAMMQEFDQLYDVARLLQDASKAKLTLSSEPSNRDR